MRRGKWIKRGVMGANGEIRAKICARWCMLAFLERRGSDREEIVRIRMRKRSKADCGFRIRLN